MDTVFLIACVVVILTISLIVLARLKKRNISDGTWPFYAKSPLMEAEQVFLHRLARALPENIILAQVPLSHFLGVKEGFSNWEWNQRIKRMSVNFLICRKDSSIIAAIELDDSSNSQNQKRERDKKKDQAIRAAGIVLIKCDLRHIPTEQGIRELIIRLDNPQSQDDQRRNARRLKDRQEVEFSGKDKLR